MPGFLKTKDAGWADAFAAEADGLEALRPHIRVPQVLDRGVQGGKAYLRLEFLHLQGAGNWRAMGQMLAQLHRQAGPRFGWHRDNYIGLAPQSNAWRDDWAEFFAECRLRPQAAKSGLKFSIDKAVALLSHKPQPSLLHGDLWSGNAGFTAEGPVIFDPAVYYGDREADLAMTELFGGFPPEFYDAYDKAFPLAEGYQERKHLYNLYHLLNHLNLFGSGYLGQVEATLRRLS
ncbi:MAG TPA: fructosamine kinase family protein [Burkholderiales bacterium]|nr:fructosamine kinase family protein [Burkholderiales bacterium]